MDSVSEWTFSVETVQSNAAILTDMGEPPQLVERRHSNMSISSQVSGQGEINVASISSGGNITIQQQI